MTDFKVGDKVRVVANAVNVQRGREATVVDIPRRDGGLFTVKGVDYPYFLASEMELVKPEPKFKVGDFVTFAEPGNESWQGGKAEVIASNGRFTTRVRIIEGPPLNMMHSTNYGHELNLDPAHLEPWVAPKPEFSVGDRVAPRDTSVSEHKGQPGTIMKVNPKSLWPFRVTFSDGEDELLRADEIEFAPEPIKQEFGIPFYAYSAAEVALTSNLFSKGGAPEFARGGKPEAVKHPAHYGGGDNPYEAIKVIEAWGLGFNLGNAAKYLARAGKKGSKVEDLKKLVEYVQFEIAKEEAK